MTTTLRMIVDQILAPVPGGIGRYAEELTRALIETAPAGCTVEAIVSSSTEAQYELLDEKLPGLSAVYKSALARRELSAAWQHGFTRLPGKGMVHATSLLAPLSRHDRVNGDSDQIAVTIHDVVPWTHPETLTAHGASWHRAMAKRAHRYADAVVVPTHAVADQLAEIMDFGQRVRVIGSAVSSKLSLPADADPRAERLGLPDRYVLAVGTLEPRKALAPLIHSFGAAGAADVPLLIVGPAGWGGIDVDSIAAEAGLEPGRVRTLGYLSDDDLSVALDRATVFVMPSLAEGFGIPVIEAFHFGTPVVHSDDPALVEVGGGAGIVVERGDAAGYPERLAAAIGSVVGDDELAGRLGQSGLDRAHLFSWRNSAEKVWQLHADL
jgi:glycosyltransferase involved in cell wall biosynthesis